MKARTKRITKLIFFIGVFSLASWFILQALQQQIQLYLTPSQFWNQIKTKQHKQFKLGGLVKKNSIKFKHNNVEFIVTDLKQEVKVVYQGLLPALFKENKGVVLTGIWQNDHVLATQVLAKHDENYTPPGINVGE